MFVRRSSVRGEREAGNEGKMHAERESREKIQLLVFLPDFNFKEKSEITPYSVLTWPYNN